MHLASSVHLRDLLLVLGDFSHRGQESGQIGSCKHYRPPRTYFYKWEHWVVSWFLRQRRVPGGFWRKDIHFWTSILNDGHSWEEIDHILVNRRWSRVIINYEVSLPKQGRHHEFKGGDVNALEGRGQHSKKNKGWGCMTPPRSYGGVGLIVLLS